VSLQTTIMNATDIANWTQNLLGRQEWLNTVGFDSYPNSSLWSLFRSFTSPTDLIKIFLFGGFLETARRIFWAAWSSFLSYFYMTATLEVYEPSYRKESRIYQS